MTDKKPYDHITRGMLGKHLSEETRRKLSLTHKGQSNWWLKGIPLTDAHKQALSRASKGRKCPPRSKEHARKISVALTGKPSPNKGVIRKARDGSLARGSVECPVVGDIRYGDELNREPGTVRHIFIRCPDCNDSSWQEFRSVGRRSKSERLCSRCSHLKKGIQCDATELRGLYLNKRLSATEIGQLKGCSGCTIRNQLRKYRIPIRIGGDAGSVTWSSAAQRHKASIRAIAVSHVKFDIGELYDLYVNQGLSTIKISALKNCSDGAISRRLETTGIPRRTTSANNLVRWSDPIYKAKVISKMVSTTHARPNKPEIALMNILNGLYPNEWKYTGDGSFMIAGLNPDYVNVNGKKQLIELFGDWWHSEQKATDWKRTEIGRMMVFNSYGYKTLVIWEHELREPDGVIARIRAFNHSYKVKEV